ncbi:MAG: DUF1552 domain-containing protein, partial [Myxococcota bacterium]
YDLWRPPTESETLTALGEEMAPLEPHKSDLLVLRGMSNRAGAVQGPYGGGGHGWSNVTQLTQAQVEVYTDSKNKERQRALGPSIDQVMAERLNARYAAPKARIDLTIAGHNYGTPFFGGARAPINGENDPATAFSSLFDSISPEAPSDELLRLRAQRRSVLDGVVSGFSRFNQRLSNADKQRVEAHLDHIRAMELQVGEFEMRASCDPTTMAITSGGADIKAPLMVDIAIHAFRCGLTNVLTLNLGDITTPWVESPLSDMGEVSYDIGHSLHHYLRFVGAGGDKERNQDAWVNEMRANRNWRTGLFGRLIQGLKDTPEDDGTMLDNSILYYTSEFSCGEQHSCVEPPCLIAGGAGGQFRTGRYLNYNRNGNSNGAMDSDASFHNLYTSFLQAAGESDTHFGNGDNIMNGPLDLS